MSRVVPLTSPCIGTCRIDQASGFCVGCARTRQEISDWRDADSWRLEQIWDELPLRRHQLGIGLHRLDWTPKTLREFVANSLRSGVGTWVTGTFGATAEFMVGTGEPVDVACDGPIVSAETSRGALRFEIADDVRALALTDPRPAGARAIVLAVPRYRPGASRNKVLTPLGKDRDAIAVAGRNALLYDFGLATDAAQFCIRTNDVDLTRALDAHVGDSWPAVLAGVGSLILRSAPTRVVLCSIGRIETFTPIPASDGFSPEGPHTHFLPTFIAAQRETPPGIDLPDSLRVCGIFYPGAEIRTESSELTSCSPPADR